MSKNTNKGESMEIENGKITSTLLGDEDHGIFSFMIDIDFNGSGQGFGGYALDTWVKSKEARIGTAFGCEAIKQVLSTLEVQRWEKLPGTPVRVKREHPRGTITEIGHFMKDKWLNLQELAKNFNE